MEESIATVCVYFEAFHELDISWYSGTNILSLKVMAKVYSYIRRTKMILSMGADQLDLWSRMNIVELIYSGWR